MEPKQYTVAWNTGCLGHMIQAIIGIEKYDIELDPSGSDSHYPESSIQKIIGHIHPYDSEKIIKSMQVIKPYFADERLKYFPKYLNYMKSQIPITAKQFARVYHRYEEPKCNKCYNIDMTNFLLDTDKFVQELLGYLALSQLKEKTLHFILKKKQSNIPLYKRYIEVTDLVLNAENIVNLTPLELGVLICHNAGNDFDKTFDLMGKYAEQG